MKIVTKMLEDELYESTNSWGNHLTIDMRPESVKQTSIASRSPSFGPGSLRRSRYRSYA